jgi:3-methylfumaryl-CoA hydratase
VTVSDAEPTLLDCGFTETADDPLPREHAEHVAACLDVDPALLEHGLLPTLWHWTYFHPTVPTAGLGVDGHPQRRAALAEFPQRMWVGGRVQVERPLRLGVDAVRSSRLVSTALKDGTGGRFWLVTVGHVVEQDGAPCLEEEQDIVFRTAGAVAPVGPDADAPEDAWVEERVADPRLLFRFSAVTGNAHRIHYDHPYATAVEGYPDLVVHGPLTAVLLAGLARDRRGHDARTVSFRARAPHFANRRFWLAGSSSDDGGAALRAVRADGTVSMTLEVR